MAARIGNVLYWTGCLLAASMIALCVYILLDIPAEDRGIVMFLPFAICAILFWAVGKAMRYILAGR